MEKFPSIEIQVVENGYIVRSPRQECVTYSFKDVRVFETFLRLIEYLATILEVPDKKESK